MPNGVVAKSVGIFTPADISFGSEVRVSRLMRFDVFDEVIANGLYCVDTLNSLFVTVKIVLGTSLDLK